MALSTPATEIDAWSSVARASRSLADTIVCDRPAWRSQLAATPPPIELTHCRAVSRSLVRAAATAENVCR